MKLAVIALIILGVLAAVSASILVSTLRTESSGSADKATPSDVEVALAKRSLPAMSVITSDHVVKRTAPRDKLPEGQPSSPAQAIGRVLAVPVVEGQVLTESCFVTEGTGALVAAALPYGMRAVSVSLSNRSLSGGLLYPGCVVDVLASFKLRSSDRVRGQGISTTLLRGIQVLAVEEDSIVSRKEDKVEKGFGGRATSRRVAVTLMVDPRQAEALQLASENGSISLAMRNPLDKGPVDIDATVLSQGRLANLGSLLTPAVFAAKTETETVSSVGQSTSSPYYNLMKQVERANVRTLAQQRETKRGRFSEGISKGVYLGEEYPEGLSPHRQVTVIRGREITEEQFAVQEQE
jgi:pilus assembly protein CpaB